MTDGSTGTIVTECTFSQNFVNGFDSGAFYCNNFVQNKYDPWGGPECSSPDPIDYYYGGVKYTGHVGNYWDLYTGLDTDSNGIGDTPFGCDAYPLMGPWEDGVILPPPELGRPIAVNDEYVTLQDQLLVVPAPGIVGNDKGPYYMLTYDPVSIQFMKGDLEPHGDGSFLYTPPPGWTGMTHFSYCLSMYPDSGGEMLLESCALVTIHVKKPSVPVPELPSAGVALAMAAGIWGVSALLRCRRDS
ncbi:MAG: hypothetical protein APR53_01020 [Methanoculleus sp. SDB]|nr:MAG: hypothetical protein APR53_01020 [Methanoculleus sp. SDB]